MFFVDKWVKTKRIKKNTLKLIAAVKQLPAPKSFKDFTALKEYFA